MLEGHIITFLPYKDFEKTARCLDNRRLGKQRVEALQILTVIKPTRTASEVQFTQLTHTPLKHPAYRMWRGYEYTLARYGHEICAEWRRRGYTDNLGTLFDEVMYDFNLTANLPWWYENDQMMRAIMLTHRSNLVSKDPSYYKWKVPNDLAYAWPIRRTIRVKGQTK